MKIELTKNQLGYLRENVGKDLEYCYELIADGCEEEELEMHLAMLGFDSIEELKELEQTLSKAF